MDIRELSDRIAMELVDAGMPAFPSHRYGFVDKYKVADLIKQAIVKYVNEQNRAKAQKEEAKTPTT